MEENYLVPLEDVEEIKSFLLDFDGVDYEMSFREWERSNKAYLLLEKVERWKSSGAGS